MITFTRKSYLELWSGSRFVSKHVNILEAAESASRDVEDNGPALYQIRIGTQLFYEIDMTMLVNTGGLVSTVHPPPPPPTEDYEAIISQVQGFAKAQGVNGGAGGALVTVTNLNNSGAGSLRAEIDAGGNKWIRFDPSLSGSITLPSTINCDSADITIDGRGANVELLNPDRSGGVLDIRAANIAILYMKLNSGNASNVSDAIIQFQSSNGLWIHQCSFTGAGDDQFSTRNSPAAIMNTTISRSRFSGASGFGPLLINGSASTTGTKSRITFLLNDVSSGSRGPRSRMCWLHFINNYFHDWNNVEYAIQTHESEAYYDSNYVTPGPNNTFQAISGGATAWCFEKDNTMTGGAFFRDTTVEGDVFAPGDFYSYTPVTADTTMRDDIIANSGWQNVPFPQ